MDFQVVLTKKAQSDLDSICDHIALDSVAAAHRFCEQLLDKATSLQHSPWCGRRIRRKAEVRQLVFKSYVIFYKVSESERRIDILRFWHAARDLGRLRLREDSGPVADKDKVAQFARELLTKERA